MSTSTTKPISRPPQDSRGFTPYALAADRPKCLATLDSYLWINEFLHSIGEDELRGVFYENDLFKEKLPKVSEKDLINKYHIMSTGTRIKLIKSFKEISMLSTNDFFPHDYTNTLRFPSSFQPQKHN